MLIPYRSEVSFARYVSKRTPFSRHYIGRWEAITRIKLGPNWEGREGKGKKRFFREEEEEEVEKEEEQNSTADSKESSSTGKKIDFSIPSIGSIPRLHPWIGLRFAERREGREINPRHRFVPRTRATLMPNT